MPEQEPMEIDPEPAMENAAEVRKTQDGSSSSQQELDLENVTKQKTAAAVLKEELQTPMGESKQHLQPVNQGVEQELLLIPKSTLTTEAP